MRFWFNKQKCWWCKKGMKKDDIYTLKVIEPFHHALHLHPSCYREYEEKGK